MSYGLIKLVQNPLWWVVPAIIIASWIVNNRDPSAGNSNSKRKTKEDTDSPKEEVAPSVDNKDN